MRPFKDNFFLLSLKKRVSQRITVENWAHHNRITSASQRITVKKQHIRRAHGTVWSYPAYIAAAGGGAGCANRGYSAYDGTAGGGGLPARFEGMEKASREGSPAPCSHCGSCKAAQGAQTRQLQGGPGQVCRGRTESLSVWSNMGRSCFNLCRKAVLPGG